MKLRFNVDLVVDDKFVEQWKNNTISYYELLYEGDQEKIKKTMEENQKLINWIIKVLQYNLKKITFLL